MHTNSKTDCYLLAVLAMLFIALLSFAPAIAHAQDTQPAAVADAAAGSGATVAAPYIVSLAQSHPWLITLVSIMGTLRFFFKPIVSLIEAWVKSTASTKDDELVIKIESSKAWKVVCWLIDLLSSIKLGPQFTTKPTATASQPPAGS